MGKPALLLIDIQKDYFDGGRFPLRNMNSVASKAATLLNHFRKTQRKTFHIRHIELDASTTFFISGTDGIEIHDSVKLINGETLIEKHFPNAFKNTGLYDILNKHGISSLVICGAMSNVCIDATTRAAVDLGYKCSVIEDACAASDVEFGGRIVAAGDVHVAFMGALAAAYCTVISLDEYLKGDKLRKEKNVKDK